jgi:two-component system OmpR family response regulator
VKARSYKTWSKRRLSTKILTLKVLIVDDDRISAEALGLALELENFEVRTASAAEEAYRLLSAWVPDVVFLDINMPDVDGFLTARIFRYSPPTRHAVIIALTAQTERYVRRWSQPNSFDGYIQKGTPVWAVLNMLNFYSSNRTEDLGAA